MGETNSDNETMDFEFELKDDYGLFEGLSDDDHGSFENVDPIEASPSSSASQPRPKRMKKMNLSWYDRCVAQEEGIDIVSSDSDDDESVTTSESTSHDISASFSGTESSFTNSEVSTPTKNRMDDDFRSPATKSTFHVAYETDVAVLKRRKKQIDYGKNTDEYKAYARCVPKYKRPKDSIWTPNKLIKYSRRSWDNQVRAWRRNLHKYDSKVKASEEHKKMKSLHKALKPVLKVSTRGNEKLNERDFPPLPKK